MSCRGEVVARYIRVRSPARACTSPRSITCRATAPFDTPRHSRAVNRTGVTPRPRILYGRDGTNLSAKEGVLVHRRYRAVPFQSVTQPSIIVSFSSTAASVPSSPRDTVVIVVVDGAAAPRCIYWLAGLAVIVTQT